VLGAGEVEGGALRKVKNLPYPLLVKEGDSKTSSDPSFLRRGKLMGGVRIG